jgi:hypothetical protein
MTPGRGRRRVLCLTADFAASESKTTHKCHESPFFFVRHARAEDVKLKTSKP